MKLACSSTAFGRLLSSGELTQIEWLDLCARTLASDGVISDVRHFPRTDYDYLAQIKKMAADLGLTVAALRSDDFFSADEPAMRADFEIASALAAPLLTSHLPSELQTSWSDVLARVGVATSLAKQYNITLAVRNVPDTLTSTTQNLKRLAKEADSAWLRFAPEPSMFDLASDPAAIVSKTVLAWHVHSPAEVESDENPPMDRLFTLLKDFRGFLAVDYRDGGGSVDAMRAAFIELRTMIATEEIGAAL
ncbi:MAG: sugar phosphate isomerase/epimerase [Candidatus Eremiobacteraeota bacterium]|nr:sugar phosphate isomerase/epimerase [Candidatus Eremiobacteraeota bacterium]